MKPTIILALALLAASCGGGSTTQNTTTAGAQSADTTATTATTKQVATEPTQELFAYEILKQLFEDPKDFERIADELENGIGEECGVPREEWGVMEHLRFTAIPDDMYPEEGYLDCFPIKTGGYFVMYSTMSCGDYEHWAYYPYIYKDGVLDKADSMLPTPGIKDYYSNSDQFPKEAANVLSMSMNNPEYSFYNEDGNVTLTVSFEAWELDERGGVLPKPLKGFQRKEDNYFPTIEYHWDGEKFARNADSKPWKEDLQYFELIPAEWKSTIAYQVAQKLNLEEEFDNQRSSDNCLYELWEDMMDAPLYAVMCFPYKNGGYLVLTGYRNKQEYKAYTFKDGNLTESDFRLPMCPLSDLLDDKKCEGLDQEIAALQQVYQKTPNHVFEYDIDVPKQEVLLRYFLDWDSGLPDEVRQKLSNIGINWPDNPRYKWNGEQFVRDRIDLREAWQKIQQCYKDEDLEDAYCFDCWPVEYHETDKIPNIERLSHKGATLSEIYCYRVDDDEYRIYFTDHSDDGCSLDVFRYKKGKMSFAELENDVANWFEKDDFPEITFYNNGKTLRISNSEAYILFDWNGRKFVQQP